MTAALHWVRRELTDNLQHARRLVEQYAEQAQEAQALDQALAHLHEVRGAAVLIQAYGLALLAEEMKQTVQDLAAGSVHEPDPAYAAVVGACVQASDYLDLLQGGQPDSALLLQPIVNELRLARGKTLLTEDDLFVAQFRVLGLYVDRATGPRSGADVRAEATRLQPVFSAALLAWFKDQNATQALSRLGRIAEILADASTDRALHQLWRTAAACVEALLSGALEDSLELKRQFGRAGQLMRTLGESGEAAAVKQMSDVALRLLFYAGRSTGKGARVTALRQGLQLDTWLPSPDAVQAARARLRGANTGLLVRVAEELRADLAEVRDSIDVALRSGGSAQEFESTAQRLKRVADTLLVLGLSAESQALAQPVETLRDAGASDPAAWMEFATAVLQVDLSLDAALYRQLRAAPDATPTDQTAAQSAGGPSLADLREGIAALLRESIVNLARVKTYVEAFVKAGDVFGLPEAARLLDEVAAGLRMVSLDRAEALVQDIRRFLQSPDFAAVRRDPGFAGRFADTVAAIEYFLELRRDALPGADDVLDQLAARVALLTATASPGPGGALPPAPAASAPADSAPFELSLVEDAGSAAAPPPPIPSAEFHLLGQPLPEPSAPRPAPAPVAAPPVAKGAVGDSEVDPEIREVFIDEAAEVLQSLQRAVPRWLRQADDREVLGNIRRGFHTLKGSGRMVGARQIGEFAWAIENMLNRVLDRTIEQSPAVMDTVRDAVALIPGMVAAFRDGSAAPDAVQPLAEQARALAEGRAAEDDSDLVRVFRTDARARLEAIMSWVGAQDRSVGEYRFPEAVVRDFHTLRGSALAIGAQPIGELAEALEAYLEDLQQSGVPLSDAGLTLLDDAGVALSSWVAHLGEAAVDAQPWLARVAKLRAAAPGSGDAASEARAQAQEAFSFETLDRVQALETALREWIATPRDPGRVAALRSGLAELASGAARFGCAPVADLARAFDAWFAGLEPETASLSDALSEALLRVVEGFYEQLDLLRDGRLVDDSANWRERVAALAPLWAEAQAPRASAGAAPAAHQPAAVAGDPELIEIFLQEGEELAEQIERTAPAIATGLDDPERLGAWLRALHTLKGSARVAGLGGIGELAHRLETATEHARHEGGIARTHFATAVRVAVDGLHELLDRVRAGHGADAETLLARFEAARAVPPGADSQPSPVPAEAAPPEQDAPDAELLAIFQPEAVELLEALGSTLHDWQQRPGDAAYTRRMQRDLHTFKGGARMAGLVSLGNAAHALETELVQLEREPARVDTAALQRIALELDALQRLYERRVLGGGLPAAVAAEAPPPPAPEPPVPSPTAAAPADRPPSAVPEAAMAAAAPEPSAPAGWNPALFGKPDAETAAAAETRREAVRVPVERLDGMLNQAGEISIFRSRMEENHAALVGSLAEMAQTITRVREQLRLMEVETEAQIAARGFRSPGAEQDRYESQFDPLEMDRYSRMQELSRSLAESVADLSALHASLDTAGSEAEGLMQQQGRIVTELQQSLMGTLMVPFSRQVQRLSRVVRQTAEQNGKLARAEFSGADSELDRNVLERMTAPLEHLLRNSVVHGIEDAAARAAAGKAAEGTVHVSLKREGSQLLIEVRDDGRGLDFAAIRAQAVKKGLMRAGVEVPAEDLARFIFAPGFSTARALTQDAGRGVGMDVVAAEVKQLGGTIDVASETGKGARFRIRLPLMLAVSQALVVQVGEELFAIPLATVEGIARVPREALDDGMRPGGPALEYAGHDYQVHRLGELVGLPEQARADSRTVPAILMRLGEGLGGGSERRIAVVAERLIGNREIVTKPAGPVLGSVGGISGATILADGRVMLIVDVAALIAEATRRRLGDEAVAAPPVATDTHRLIMVVDDSITIRRVTERLLTRKGFRVITAKDGLDAMASLQTESPDAVLLDIEMPRADGFEVAAFIRNNPRIARLPIIMITSRSGDKHREHARSLGVDRYLIKPYQEDQLLAELQSLLVEGVVA